MESHIQIKLFASLQKFMPASAENYAIEPGITVGSLLEQLGIPQDLIKIVFIDSVQAELTSTLNGGERVGIFPPVGGGWSPNARAIQRVMMSKAYLVVTAIGHDRRGTVEKITDVVVAHHANIEESKIASSFFDNRQF